MLTLSLQRLYKRSGYSIGEVQVGGNFTTNENFVKALPSPQFAIKIKDALTQALGRGAMAAHRTLDPWILVRIQAPQPSGRQ